jgi:tetratricopeptide (TPR) repeat protein
VLQTQFADAERFVRQSLTLIEEKDHSQRAYLLGSLGSVLTHRGSFAEAAEAVQSAIIFYRAMGNWMVAPNMSRLSQILLHQGKYEECLLLMDAIQSVLATSGSQLGMREIMTHAHPSKQCEVALARGHYAEAYRYAEQALAAWTPVSYARYQRATLASQLALALWGLGRHEDARIQLSSALEDALQNRTYLGLLLAICAGALLELQRGNIARGLEFYTTIAGQPLVANSLWYADIAGKKIAAAASQLPVEIMASARQRGETAELWESGQRLADSLFA